MTSNESPATEGVQSEELPEMGAEPTMINVRTEGLKLDLVLLKNRVSGLTIDYQNISESEDLHRWLRIIEGMLSGSAPSPGGSFPQILGEAVRPPASQPRHPKGPEDGLENAEPTMINVRSEGLKLDLVLLKNRVSGLTIDYQNISESGELQKWIGIVDGMLSSSAPSPKGSIPQAPDEVARPPAPQPQPQEEEQEEKQEEKQEEEQREPLEENDYRKIILHAVDVSLDTLGSAGKQAVLSLLENRYGLSEKDIPDHPRGFVALLEELLGASARTLEREIVSNIRLVSAAPGENLEAVVESLKKHHETTTPAEVDAEGPTSIATETSAVAIASTQEGERPPEEKTQNLVALKDSVPGLNYSLTDPIPVGFRYNATYSRHRS
jgi:hypothetical protein